MLSGGERGVRRLKRALVLLAKPFRPGESMICSHAASSMRPRYQPMKCNDLKTR